MSVNLVEKFGAKYTANTVIFREGDTGDDMFIVHEGEVIISKKARNAEQVLAVLKDGDFFGEMALFTDQQRSATATVNKSSVILRLKPKSFEYMIQNNRDFAVNMIAKLCHRLRRADQQIEELLVVSQETRILKALDTYWKQSGQKDATGQSLLVPYKGFLEFVNNTMGISLSDSKANLLKLKQQDLVHIRQDMQSNYYISFSPKIFDYIQVI